MKTEKLIGAVHADPDILDGTPVFIGTRVPLQNLIDSLEGGESIEDFRDGFPSVSRAQVLEVIEAGKMPTLERVKRSDAFAFLADNAEDIYTLADGEPFHNAK